MTRNGFQRVLVSSFLILVFSGHEWSSVVTTPSTRSEHLMMSVLWFQRSAETRALFHQAFNLARLRLEEDLATHKGEKRRAVVIDIDETVLDNSPHMGKMIKNNEVFPYAWTEWVKRAEAEPLPGAVEFLTYADSKGYDIFYVSNRAARTETDGTVENLKKRGFPQVVPAHIMLKQDQSSKEQRRRTIEQTHEIILLIGDNLNDLDDVFERKSVSDRSGEVDKVKEKFGTRFIVLPNPMYGDWENALYEYRRGLSDEQKAELREESLRSF